MIFGIIGFGRMGRVYYDVLSKMNIKVDFVCDLHPPKMDIQFYQDYKKAIDHSKVDGIIISTYGPSHGEIMMYAIEKGIKYIICEKPFTTSVKKADEIIDELRKSNTRLTINYARRFSNIYSILKNDLVQNDIVGKPRSMIITCGAGGLSTVGTHFFDLISYILGGNLKSIYAVPINKNLPNPRGKEFEDPGGYVLLTFDNETRAFLDFGDDLGLQHLIEIVGEYGRIIIDETNEIITIRSRTLEDRNKSKHLYSTPNHIVRDDTFRLESLNELIIKMLNNLISDSSLMVTAEEAKKSVEIYSAIRKCYDTKLPVSLPLTDSYYEKEFMVT